MNNKTNRRGSAARMVLGTIGALLMIPMAMFAFALVAYQKTHAQAEAERAQAVVAEQEAVKAHLEHRKELLDEESSVAKDGDRFWVDGQTRRVYRPIEVPIVETEYRKVRRQTVDPATGKTQIIEEMQPNLVRRRATQYFPVDVPLGSQLRHGNEVRELVGELRQMDADADGREAKLVELKSLLSEEFDQKHEQQQKEIERTQARLEKLREMHSKRESAKQEIVQRRIDQLLGEPDPLQWDIGAVQPGHDRPLDLPRVEMTEEYSEKSSGLPGTGGASPPMYAPGLFPPEPALAPTARRPAPPVPSSTQSRTESTVRVTSPIGLAGPPSLRPGRDAQSGVVQTTIPPQPPLPGPPRAPALSPRAVNPPGSPAGIESPSAGWTPSNDARTWQPSGGNSVYDLANTLSAARAAEASAKAELEQAEKLRDKNAITQSEFEKNESRRQRAARELAIREAQWRATEERLKRELEFAERELERNTELFQGVQQSYQQGHAEQTDVLKAMGSVEQAEKQVADLKAQLQQMQKIGELLDGEP